MGLKSSEIPKVVQSNGTKIWIIAATVDDQQRAVRDIVMGPEYLDVTVPAGTEFSHPTQRGHTVLAYAIEWKG
ncbi:MAG: hypothetical protein WCF90_04845 [Methanomicrobiales archaeon]